MSFFLPGLLLAAQESLGTSHQVYLDLAAQIEDQVENHGVAAVFKQYKLDALLVTPEPCTAGVVPSAIAGWPIVSGVAIFFLFRFLALVH